VNENVSGDIDATTGRLDQNINERATHNTTHKAVIRFPLSVSLCPSFSSYLSLPDDRHAAVAQQLTLSRSLSVSLSLFFRLSFSPPSPPRYSALPLRPVSLSLSLSLPLSPFSFLFPFHKVFRYFETLDLEPDRSDSSVGAFANKQIHEAGRGGKKNEPAQNACEAHQNRSSARRGLFPDPTGTSLNPIRMHTHQKESAFFVLSSPTSPVIHFRLTRDELPTSPGREMTRTTLSDRGSRASPFARRSDSKPGCEFSFVW
jgi:hypothetical protein